MPLFSGLYFLECDISLLYLFENVCRKQIFVTQKKAFSSGIHDQATFFSTGLDDGRDVCWESTGKDGAQTPSFSSYNV